MHVAITSSSSDLQASIVLPDLRRSGDVALTEGEFGAVFPFGEQFQMSLSPSFLGRMQADVNSSTSACILPVSVSHSSIVRRVPVFATSFEA